MSKQASRYNLCDVNNSCLIIIDVQAKLSSSMEENAISDLRKNTDILLKAANQLAVPIIATAQYPKGLGPVEDFITNQLNEASKSYEKTQFSCLGIEELSEYLTQTKKKQIILTGIEAHICVLQSAIDFMAEAYEVFVVTDAIASRKSKSYQTALLRLNSAGVSLLTTESVLFEWLRDAANPDFKALSKLIV